MAIEWWYMECPLCSNRDNVGWCTKALFKPKSVDGVCKYFITEDDIISDEVREILIQYQKDKKEGKVKTAPLRDLRK